MFQPLHVIAPQAGLCLEHGDTLERRMFALRVGFLAVDVGRQPDTGLQVRPPAIEMQVVFVTGVLSVDTVEPDDVEIPILYPDAPCEQSLACFFTRANIYNNAANFAEEFLPHVLEVVAALLEVSINERHLCKAVRNVLCLEQSCQCLERISEPSRLARLVFVEYSFFRRSGEIRTTKEIRVGNRLDIVLFVFVDVLDVCFGKRMHPLHGFHKQMFALHHSINHAVKTDRSQYRELGMLGDFIIAVDADYAVLAADRLFAQGRDDSEGRIRRPFGHKHLFGHLGGIRWIGRE